MPATVIGSVEVSTPAGDVEHIRLQIDLPAAEFRSAVAAYRVRYNAGQTPPRTLAADAHAVAASILDAGLEAEVDL